MFENKFVSLPSHLNTIEQMEVNRESRTMCNTETSKVISRTDPVIPVLLPEAEADVSLGKIQGMAGGKSPAPKSCRPHASHLHARWGTAHLCRARRAVAEHWGLTQMQMSMTLQRGLSPSVRRASLSRTPFVKLSASKFSNRAFIYSEESHSLLIGWLLFVCTRFSVSDYSQLSYYQLFRITKTGTRGQRDKGTGTFCKRDK